MVAAATDLRRAGLTVPIPRELLVRLYPQYLSARGIDPPAADEPAVTDALAWACERHDRATGLLATRERGKRYQAFDYLVDYYQRDPVAPPVPQIIWQSCLEDPDPGELIGVAIAAFALRRPEIAEAALRRRASAGDLSAMNALGNVLHRARHADEAEIWYRKAADQGDPAAMTNLGALLTEIGRTSEAETWYQQAIGLGELGAMYNLGLLRDEAGDDTQAESWYLRTVEGLKTEEGGRARIGAADDASTSIGQEMHTAATMAMTALAALYERQGKQDDALSWYTRAAELDDPEAMTGLAALLDSAGQPQQAAVWRQRAAQRGQRPQYDQNQPYQA